MPVTRVEELTGFPECLDGRVKTLHPKVHAGPARRPAPGRATRRSSPSSASSRSTCWSATSTRSRRPSPPARDVDECVEQIDIGGPAMVRAAAKNHASVAVVTSPGRRTRRCIGALGEGGFTLAAAPRAGRPGVRRHRRVRRGGGPVVRPGAGPGRATRWPAVRRARRCASCGGAALRREPAPAGRALRRPGRPGRAGPGRAAARQGDVLQQLRRRRRRLAGGQRLRPSRRWRSSSTPTRAASRSAPTWPRRTARRTPATRSRPSAA